LDGTEGESRGGSQGGTTLDEKGRLWVRGGRALGYVFCLRGLPEWIHFAVVGRLTPSKDGNQEITTPDLHKRLEHPNLNTPTGIHQLNHPNLTTQTCKPNLNTAPTCVTSITIPKWIPHSSNSTSSTPYITSTPALISSSTPSTSAPTSSPPSTAAP
jgi:hypothetical protein